MKQALLTRRSAACSRNVLRVASDRSLISELDAYFGIDVANEISSATYDRACPDDHEPVLLEC